MITRIVFSTSTPRKYYSCGDTRLRGKTVYVKQLRMTYDRMYGGWCGMSRRGKSLTEWVVKDGPRDRNSPNWKDPYAKKP